MSQSPKSTTAFRSAGLRFSEPSLPKGDAELILWAQANWIERAVMEASGDYERSWAQNPAHG
jgi:hypothetical protein